MQSEMPLDELVVAEQMAAGKLPSPQRYKNIYLVNMRMTGTGASYRPDLKEQVWRDPTSYLNDRFLKRATGIPITIGHPDNKSLLDGKEFEKRIVGISILPYIKGDEVWTIGRFYDGEIIKLLIDNSLSTSPGVEVGEGYVYEIDNTDKTLLIELEPSFVDHLAIAKHGVWDKGQQPDGIEISIKDDDMTINEETLKNLFSEGLGPLASRIDGIAKSVEDIGVRVDAIESVEDLDARIRKVVQHCFEEERGGAKRVDETEKDKKWREEGREEIKERDKKRDDARDARDDLDGRLPDDELERKDRKRKDEKRSEEGELERDDRKRKDEKRAEDGEFERSDRKRKDEKRAKDGEFERDDDDREKDESRRERDEIDRGRDEEREDKRKERSDSMAEARSFYDQTFANFGIEPRKPFYDENVRDYRIRMLNQIKQHADSNLKSINFDHARRADDATFGLIENNIVDSAIKNYINSRRNTKGLLTQIIRKDEAGREIRHYEGDIKVALAPFMCAPMKGRLIKARMQ